MTLYNINALFTSSFSCLNTYVLCTLHVLQSEHVQCPNICVIVAAARLDVLDYLLVDGSVDTTRVIGKESVSGTGSSFKGWEGKTGLT